MNKLYFTDLKEAQRVAKKRGKKVYKMYSGEYFVGTYKQVINRLNPYYKKFDNKLTKKE